MTRRRGRRMPVAAMREALSAFFGEVYGRRPAAMARAPGRVEFIGNHTDYNGGAVMGAAIDRSVWVAVAAREDDRRRFLSGRGGTVVEQRGPRRPVTGEGAWVNYPTGVGAALAHFGLDCPGGFDLAVMADLPVGAGLSSSAAIELATALALLELTGASLERQRLVELARWAENEFVGMPCGILDQGVSGFGRRGRLVWIDCHGPRFATVPLPASLRLVVFNTATQHALIEGLYAERHRECMTAAAALGVSALATATLGDLEAAKPGLTPGGYDRARHVIEEHARVMAARSALERGDFGSVGALLTASHRSSQKWFQNSTAELDFLVDALTACPGVLGARLTGGGFGGAVMALVDESYASATGVEVQEAYARKFGLRPEILELKTADGAEVVKPD